LFAETKSYTKRAALIFSFLIPNSGYFSYVENFIDADRCCSSNLVCGTAAPSSFRAQPANGFLFLNYANHDARLWGMDLSARADLFNHPAFGQFGTHTTMGYVRGERMDAATCTI